MIDSTTHTYDERTSRFSLYIPQPVYDISNMIDKLHVTRSLPIHCTSHCPRIALLDTNSSFPGGLREGRAVTIPSGDTLPGWEPQACFVHAHLAFGFLSAWRLSWIGLDANGPGLVLRYSDKGRPGARAA